VGTFGSVLHCQKEEEKTLENPIEQHLIAVPVRQLGSVLFKFTVLLFIIIQYGSWERETGEQKTASLMMCDWAPSCLCVGVYTYLPI
jgi:hypothetical protein